LDFTLREALPFEEIRARLKHVYAAVEEQSGILFAFGRQDPRVHLNTLLTSQNHVSSIP
jgi:hypothetical protein